MLSFRYQREASQQPDRDDIDVAWVFGSIDVSGSQPTRLSLLPLHEYMDNPGGWVHDATCVCVCVEWWGGGVGGMGKKS